MLENRPHPGSAETGPKLLISQWLTVSSRFGDEAALSGRQMASGNSLSRRWFILSGTSLRLSQAAKRAKNENVYRFATRDWDVLLTVEFYDRYASEGFWFEERHTDRHYCLSAKGEESRECLANFSGSLAVARYKIRSRANAAALTALREYVRTIDQDERLQARPPVDRVIELQHGAASDIQAFGYEVEPSRSFHSQAPELYGPWCLLRQDLYIEGNKSPFLVVHWKHALDAIRILDVIPGRETRALEE
jgi:hypothetical protein